MDEHSCRIYVRVLIRSKITGFCRIVHDDGGVNKVNTGSTDVNVSKECQ